MTNLPVTQFLRPNGRKITTFINVDDEIAEIVYQKRMRLSCEVLITGDVAVYVRRPEWDEALELVEICINGPTTNTRLSQVDGMIKIIKEAEKLDEYYYDDEEEIEEEDD
jgi:hypothetical protein